MKVVREYMAQINAQKLYPKKYICLEKKGNQYKIEDSTNGEKYSVLTFCSNDLLGMAQNAHVKQAAIDAILNFGTSNSSCEALSGRIDLHRRLEQVISDFKGLPHTHLFLNAWMALQALIDSFVHLAIPVAKFKNTRETIIFSDIYNHGCIISAISQANKRSGRIINQSPKVRIKYFRHNDMKDLAKKMKRCIHPHDRVMIIGDAVFSMDADIAPLPDMIEIASAYPDTVIVMDEAHSSGILGNTGRGIYEHFGLTPQNVIEQGLCPIIMTTFSKFAGSAGAALSSDSRELIDLLSAAPTTIQTISLPAAATAAAMASIEQLRENPQIPIRIIAKSEYARNQLRAKGFEVLGDTNILPIMLDSHMFPKDFADHLIKEHGIWVSPIWFVAKPRLRMTINALHTIADIDRLVEAMVSTRAHLGKQKPKNLQYAASLPNVG